ncbi:hypothetical protein SAMN05443245_5178 [Paraburkholderia fungorum]|uniref:DUF551 domain-containing protein n=1 Tax=Paraburkholderia fungorum TaxID=134537 RepID=A0A1H1IHB0_9BURK|nr:DUF551 domain-containing protein [Paraburkholderia fungorum]SDR37050.1 hypothetical protein SAMN05443245_5178 [Paraburkholderia fungorum]
MTTSNQLGAMMTDAKNIIDSLRKQAAQIAKEGHFGWGNIDNDAADTIERMVAQIALLSASKPAAYVNGFELDSMLPDDETAGPDRTPGIQRTQSQFRSVPLYRTPQIAAPAQSGETIYQVLDPIEGGWSDGPRSLYDATDGAFRRIVYTAPQPTQPAPTRHQFAFAALDEAAKICDAVAERFSEEPRAQYAADLAAQEIRILADQWKAVAATAREPVKAGERPDPNDIQGWSVTVNVNAQDILTIGHNSLSGIDGIEDFAQVVRNCAEHLLSFIGKPEQSAVVLDGERAIIPDDIAYALRVYGDARAGNGDSDATLRYVVRLIHQALARAASPQATAPDCQACGDGITAHDPGICGNCFAMKYRDASPQANWISVEDGLPKDGQLVLIAFSDGGIDFSHRHSHRGVAGWSGVHPVHHQPPTHWMVPPTTPADIAAERPASGGDQPAQEA